MDLSATHSVSESDINLNLEDNCHKENTIINSYHLKNEVPN
jgi:hypothetical protein